MIITAIEGVVENGRIRLCEDVPLAENARVYVILADLLTRPPVRIHSPRLAQPQQASDFRKQIVEIPGDAEL